VKEVMLFLDGKNRQLIEILRRRMEEASRGLLFEEAARLRNQIQSIEQTVEQQKIVSYRPVDRDVIGCYGQEAVREIHVMFVRQGKLTEGQSFTIASRNLAEEEILSAFVKQFYAEGRLIPREILLPMAIEDADIIAEWLTDQRGRKVTVKVPKHGLGLQLLKMGQRNAQASFAAKQAQKETFEVTLAELKSRLRLSRIPRRVECFDISNIMGSAATGSMVVFQNGQPEKSQYRRFRIRTLSKPDDYGMMYEVLARRYAREDSKDSLPDLIMVDGGKGQLQVVLEVFKDFGITGIDAIALAKSRGPKGRRGSKDKSGEKVYLQRIKDPIHLPRRAAATLLLQKIRDESHRFAISYHKKLRKQRDLHSVLDDIPGVGKIRKGQLLSHFKTISQIKDASIEDLQAALGKSRATAEKIHRFLHP
jgi:excinuclease ABC subunit C